MPQHARQATGVAAWAAHCPMCRSGWTTRGRSSSAMPGCWVTWATEQVHGKRRDRHRRSGQHRCRRFRARAGPAEEPADHQPGTEHRAGMGGTGTAAGAGDRRGTGRRRGTALARGTDQLRRVPAAARPGSMPPWPAPIAACRTTRRSGPGRWPPQPFTVRQRLAHRQRTAAPGPHPRGSTRGQSGSCTRTRTPSRRTLLEPCRTSECTRRGLTGLPRTAAPRHGAGPGLPVAGASHCRRAGRPDHPGALPGLPDPGLAPRAAHRAAAHGRRRPSARTGTRDCASDLCTTWRKRSATTTGS